MVFYIFVPNFDDDKFQHQDCSQNVYCDALPDQPSNMPNPRGQGFIVNAYVDIYHSGDTVTRGSLIGILLWMVESIPVYKYWYYPTVCICPEKYNYSSSSIYLPI